MQASVNNPPFLKMEQIRGWQYSFSVFQDYLYAEFVANKFIFVNPKKVKRRCYVVYKNHIFFFIRNIMFWKFYGKSSE